MLSRQMNSLPSRPRPHYRFLAGVLLTLALALLFFYWLLRPSMAEMQAMALFLAITAGLSILVGYLAYRSGWLRRAPRIAWALTGGYVLAGLLTFLNVWLTARLMFASTHDLRLATVLLIFAGGIAVSLGYFLSAALNDSIRQLREGALALSRGAFHIRVPVEGNNEVADLARAFNEMAAQLDTTDRERRRLETMRRNLLAWAGHDLRTPVASIQAMLEALADGMIDDPQTVERYVQASRHEVRALSRLIDDLFDLAQFDAGGLTLDRQPTDIADLLSNTLARFAEQAARKHIRLAGDVEAGTGMVLCDAQKIERVLANLVANALRHTPEGGEVLLRGGPKGDEVWIAVQDTGPGIEPQDLPHIFEQFYRGERSRSRATGGAGLGLAIARAILEAHGGGIVAENVPGGGARFTIFLPR
ncbi:MAG: HAMP domain-containing protein [Caldilineae bacterium]|nr:MAG: HAMP domain-containing protein [Caldilineae bacterium]